MEPKEIEKLSDLGDATVNSKCSKTQQDSYPPVHFFIISVASFVVINKFKFSCYVSVTYRRLNINAFNHLDLVEE